MANRSRAAIMETRRVTIASWCMAILLSLSLNDLPPTIGQESNDVKSSIRKNNGVETVEFDTLVGRVEVNFPDDMSDTDTISGTVLVEPKGETKEEIAQNEDTLRGYVVEIEKTQEVPEPPPQKPPLKRPPCGGGTISLRPQPPRIPPKTPPICPPSGTRSGGTCPATTGQPPSIIPVPGCRGGFTTSIPPKCGGVEVVIKNSGGTPICSLPVPTKPVPPKCPPGCRIPNTCTAGGPICIQGKTDGCSWTTNVKVNGQTCLPVCESPRQTVALTPPGVKGPCTVSVTEQGRTTCGTTNLVPGIICALPRPRPTPTDKLTFRRTGPFIEETRRSSVGPEEKLVVSKNQVTYTGIGVDNTSHTPTSCSFIFSEPPEAISVGDRFSFTGQTSGDPDVSPLATFGCRSEGFWTRLLNPPIKHYSNSRILLKMPDYVSSGTQNFEVLDARKKIEEFKRNNPDKIRELSDPKVYKIDMVINLTAGSGDIGAEIKWTYVLDKPPKP